MYKIIPIFLFLLLFTPFVLGHVTSQNDIVKVIITDKGFEPNFVSVHLGSMVIWVNEGQKPHWPASDVHPSHTLYPGSDINKCETGANILDACKGLEKGESFSFVFDQKGRWGMHDHLAPGHSMTIYVSGEIQQQNDENQEQSQSIFNKIINMVLKFFSKKE